MGHPVYDVPAGSVLPIPFPSYDSNGASVTLSGLATTDIKVYRATSTTQRASENGYTLLDTDGIDFDGLTGIHAFSIDTGDDTDSGFYIVGQWYTVVVSAVTIDSQTVNFIAAQFRLIAAEDVAGTPAVNVTHIGQTAQTTGQDVVANINSILVDTGTTLQAELDGIQADTEDIQTQIGTAGAGLTDLGGMSTGMKAEVNAEVLDVLNTDTFAEPGQGAPAATASLATKIGHLYKAWRNKKDNDGSTTQLYADDGSTVDAKQTTSESTGTVTKGEWVTGP
jgi:hypothetical protein